MTKSLSDDVKEKYLEMIPSSYFGDPNEVANVVKFALSAEAKYINGTNIAVNGGIV
ncbi:SDR family oxidoreductase [Zobellia laminariae]|nr:SDR family oxidoreductase [Zobellia laminariae]WKX76564.1 SDR family oxidoreductase [Zobellia laminariae]